MPRLTSIWKGWPSPSTLSWRTPMAWLFMPSIAPVSEAVSPWSTWVEEPSTITGIMPRRVAAPAQADLVRVLLSKNIA